MKNEIGEQIEAIRREWGKRLLILGHHYQGPLVLRHVDAKGDSLELARAAASHPEAEKIVFCGVKFMAESADILTGGNQTVYMPETLAGCPMANMADADGMRKAWEVLRGGGDDWLPVVYVNSTAEVKASCGELNGSACTSSNAPRVLQWVFGQKKRVFFLPDEHLGANTAFDMGIPDGEVKVYDPRQEDGGLRAEDIRAARVVVWKGFCIVHVGFGVHQIQEIRRRSPTAKIIVHPETPREVVRLADAHGSTAQIIRYVETAPAGSEIVVGTELNMVSRLAEEQRGRVTVRALLPSVCANMAKTNERNLLAVLRNWPIENEIHVPAEVAEPARRCLQTMLTL
jgi:quinolinate synthase